MQTWLKVIPYVRIENLKKKPPNLARSTHTYIAHVRESPPPVVPARRLSRFRARQACYGCKLSSVVSAALTAVFVLRTAACETAGILFILYPLLTCKK